VTGKARLHEPKSSSQWREGDPSLVVAEVDDVVDDGVMGRWIV
jgi:hypothetical protein